MGGSYQSAAEGLSAGSPSGASSGAPTPGVFAGGASPNARPGSPGGAFGAVGAPAPSKPALSEPGGPKPDPAPATPTLGSARPDQMAAIRARKAEQEREQAARDEAARARDAAADQAAERRREDRLKAMARRRTDQTAARQSTSRQSTSAQAAESTRLFPQGATVDDRIRSLMRDPRYWKDRDPGLLEHVTRQWARAYPGASLHTGFKRRDPQPAIRPEAVEPWPPILEAPQRPLGLARPGMLPPHPTPAVHKPGWTWNGWTGEWERMTPEEAAAQKARLRPRPLKAEAPTPAAETGPPTLGHNSGLTREDALDALREKAADGSMSPSAFLKEAERIRQAHPDDGADGVRVQVAAAQALPWAIGALGLGAGIGALPGPEIPDGDTDAPSSPPPSAPSGDSAKDADGAGWGGGRLVFPDGVTRDLDAKTPVSPPDAADAPPASPDQSDVLPQGTILRIDGYGDDGDEGPPARIDVSGASPKAVDAFNRARAVVPPGPDRRAYKGLIDGGRLTTRPGARDHVVNIDKTGGLGGAVDAFHTARVDCGVPHGAVKTDPKTGAMSFKTPAGNYVTLYQSSEEDPTTSYIDVSAPTKDAKFGRSVQTKIRFKMD